VNIHLNSQSICSNEALVVSLGSSSAPVEITWDFGDGTTAEGPTAMHVYNEAGNYQLSLTARSVLNEELLNKESYMIQVNPTPLAQFEMKMADNMLAYPKVDFISQSEDASSLEWVFNDENIENSQRVEKMYAKKGSYSVGLIVSNQFLCSDTAVTYFIIENDYNLLAPNAFSPNGDGINDTFIPQAIPYLNQEFTLQVFDPKTGQMIFETSNFDLPWNGRFMNNGNRLGDGAYAWSVIMEDGSVYKGTILITTK
jgi:gliding motility-associated-like protein